VKNTIEVDLISLPEYVDVPPNDMKNWTYNPRNAVGIVNALHWVMGKHRNAGLTPEDIIASLLAGESLLFSGHLIRSAR
jgi:hypothetical protein